MTLYALRAALLLAIGLGLLSLILQRERALAMLRAFLFTPSSPINLAALRVIVFSMIFALTLSSDATFFASLPEGLRSLPPGWGFLDHVLPFDETSVQFAQRALLITSGLAALGFASRITTGLASLLALFVLGMPNFYVKVNHSTHIIVMCALVVACSRSGDTLALDRLFRLRAPRPADSAVYTIPVRFCWLLIGTVYFFPGLWKLWESGDLWVSGFQLHSEMYKKWGNLQHFEPLFRLDQHPVLLALLGCATLVFELGFIFALFNRYTRIVAAFSAIGFHLGVKHVMGITFNVYFPLVVLLDFPQIWQLLRSHLPQRLRTRLPAAGVEPEQASAAPSAVATAPFSAARRARAPFVMGVLLFTAQLATGLFRINTWPVSVYPTFSTRRDTIPSRASRSVLVFEPADGRSPHELPEDIWTRLGSARVYKLFDTVSRVANKKSRAHTDGRVLIGMLRQVGAEIDPGDAIAVYQAHWDVFPLGERANYDRVLINRFRIRDDLSLEPQRTKERAKRKDADDAPQAALPGDD